MPTWTSYEPHPSGNGAILYDDAGNSLAMADNPALQAALPTLQPRQSAMGDGLAANDVVPYQGTSKFLVNVDPSAPKAAPATRVDAGAPIELTPIAPKGGPVPTLTGPVTFGTSAASRALPADISGGTQDLRSVKAQVDAANAPPPTALPGPPPPLGPQGGQGPTRPAGREMSETERRLREAEEREMADNARVIPGVRKAAEQRDTTRTVQGKELDPKYAKDVDDAQAEVAALEGENATFQSERKEEIRQLEEGKQAKAKAAGAAQDEAAAKYKADVAAVDAETEKRRHELEDPNVYWNSRTTGQKVGAMVSMALTGIGRAIGGKDIGDLHAQLNAAIAHDQATRHKNLTLLDQKRGKAGESFKSDTEAREAQLKRDYDQVNMQIEDAVKRAQNPIIRDIVFEQKPDSDELQDPITLALGRVRDKFRAAGHDLAPDLISATNPDKPFTPIQRVARENVRDLAGQIAQARAKADAAKQRLGLALELAPTKTQNSQFIAAHTEGGRGPRLDKNRQILEGRNKREGEGEDRDIKREEVSGKSAAAQAQAQDRTEGRTVLIDGRPHVGLARSESEYAKVRDTLGTGEALLPQLRKLEEDAGSLSTKLTPGRREKLKQDATQAYEQLSTFLGQGVLNKAGYDSAEAFASDYIGSKGGAARAMIGAVTARRAALLSQHGFKPAQGGR